MSGEEVSPAKDRRTVFVQGISFDVNDNDFEEAFGEIGPIRKCFLLRNRGQERHRGLGYVQFALPEDASRAVQDYNGKILLGRQVQVTPATKRASLAERKQRKREEAELQEHEQAHMGPPTKKAKLGQQALMDDKQKALRTVALGSFPPHYMEQAIELASSVGEVEGLSRDVSEEAQAAAKLRHDGCTGSVVLVTYKTVKAAVEAVIKLHGVPLLRKKQKGSQSISLWARQLKGEGAMVKKWRLILRNLPFNVKLEDLKGFLTPAGFVWEITIPCKDDGTSKGFAFASFTSKALAERGIKLTNGKKLRGRIVAVDWAVSKTAFESGSGDVRTGNIGEEDEKLEPSSPPGFKDREDDTHEAQIDMLTEREMMRALADKMASADDAEARQAKSSDLSKPQAMSGGAERKARVDQAEAGPSSRAAAAAAAGNPHQPAQKGAIGRTVFVRGVGSSVTKQQLQARLESFGPVTSCRLVMNPATQQPKGTAFVEFKDASHAMKAVEACAKGRSGGGPGVSVGGISLEIATAVTQEDARAMASTKTGNASTRDKRNLYLAKEGLIEEGSAIWQDMSRGDQEKRLRANKEKTTKLRSPNFFVSATRLSIRNMPFTTDEKSLKSLLISMVKKRATKAVPRIKQVKVLRDPARKGKDGKPQAKGIAFAEFLEHEHALCALRELNNNPEPFGKDRRPIVEFAVENAQTVKKREHRIASWKGEGRAKKQPEKVDFSYLSTPFHAIDEAGQQTEPQLEQGKVKSKKKRKSEQRGGGGIIPETSKQGLSNAVRGSAKRQQGSTLPETAKMAVNRRENPHATNPEHDFKRKPGQNGELGLPKKLAQTKKKPRDPDGAQQGREKRHRKAEKSDRLDNLISKYRESLFGGDKSSQTETQKGSLKRWFE